MRERIRVQIIVMIDDKCNVRLFKNGTLDLPFYKSQHQKRKI